MDKKETKGLEEKRERKKKEVVMRHTAMAKTLGKRGQKARDTSVVVAAPKETARRGEATGMRKGKARSLSLFFLPRISRLTGIGPAPFATRSPLVAVGVFQQRKNQKKKRIFTGKKKCDRERER